MTEIMLKETLNLAQTNIQKRTVFIHLFVQLEAIYRSIILLACDIYPLQFAKTICTQMAPFCETQTYRVIY